MNNLSYFEVTNLLTCNKKENEINYVFSIEDFENLLEESNSKDCAGIISKIKLLLAPLTSGKRWSPEEILKLRIYLFIACFEESHSWKSASSFIKTRNAT